MIAFFRSKYSILIFSGLLLFGFSLKTSVCLEKKWSIIFADIEDDLGAEEESSAKNESKSGNMARKAWYFQWHSNHHYATKEPSGWEAHNSVYLLAVLSEPKIAILTQPPEFS